MKPKRTDGRASYLRLYISESAEYGSQIPLHRFDAYERDTRTERHTYGQTDTHMDKNTDTHIPTDRHRQTHGHTDRMTKKLEIRKRTVHIKLQSQEKNSQEMN